MSKSLDDTFAADAAPDDPTNDELKQIAALAARQVNLEQEIADLNERLSALTADLRDVSDRALPELMMSVGMKKFVLVDGSTVNVKGDVTASIRADFTAQAVAWLDGKGLGDVVKDEIKVSLGKGEASFSQAILQAIRDLGFDPSEKYSVHPSTLKSLVKEQLAKGIEFPAEFFSVHQYQRAEIKRPKRG